MGNETSLEIGANALNMEGVKNNILDRIKRHRNDIVFLKQQLEQSAMADDIEKCENRIRNIRSLQERESELEMVLKYCF